MSAASVLVTGASGFIGAHLVARLLSEGSRVTVLGKIVKCAARRVARSRSYCYLRRLQRKQVCGGFWTHLFDAVFHLAAYGVRPTHRDIDEMLRINVELPAALVRLCANGARAW